MYELFLLDLGLVIVFATVFSFASKLLRQPLIPAYILAGILLGSEGFGIVKDPLFVKILSELGIAFLLFITGVEFEVEKLKHLGKTIMFVGFFQIIITTIIGYSIFLFLGFSHSVSLYMGIFLSFSSTMIVVKFMRDINQISTLHGRIVLGILLIQDIVAVSILAGINNLNNFSLNEIVSSIVSVFGLFSISFILSKTLMRGILRIVSREQDILFLFSLSILFLFSLVSYIFRLPISIGAFLAGLALAEFPYNVEISSKISSLKEFFSVIFFVSLGMELDFSIIHTNMVPVFLLFISVIFLKPVILYILMSIFEHERKTSLFTSVYLGQMSEFSLIMAMEAVKLKIIPYYVLDMVTFVVLLSLLTTPYFIQYSLNIFYFLDRYLLYPLDKVIGFGRKHYSLEDLSKRSKKFKDHVVVCGSNLLGRHVVDHLLKKDIPFVIIDFDPEIVEKYYKEGVPVIYGDVTHPEVLEHANISRASLVISTVPNTNDNLFLIDFVKKNSKARIVCRAHDLETGIKYYESGADYVVIPKLVAAMKITSLLEKLWKGKDSSVKKIREESIKMLEKEYLHEILDYKKEFIMKIKNKFQQNQ